MLRKLMRLAALPALLGLGCGVPMRAAEVQTVRLTAPVLGYIFDDTSKTIRRISGIPGAAGLDASLQVGVGLQSAVVDASARLAIGVTKEGFIALVRWSDGDLNATEAILETGLGHLTEVALAGNFAVLTDGAKLEVWSNLKDQPGRVSQFALETGIGKVAISTQGVAAAATGGGQVFVLHRDAATAVASAGTWTALAFAGNDLLAAEAANGELVQFEGGLNRVLLAKLPGIPVSLVASRDGASALVSFPENLALVQLAGGMTSVACGCEAKRLDLLEGNLVVHLAGPEQTLVVDADGTEVRVMEIPGSAAAQAEGSAQ